MLDKDKMIEEVAQAIRLVNLYGNNDGHEFLEGSRKIAKAAIKAMCAGLPIVSSKEGILKRASDEMNIYNQLLSWGKDDTI